MAYYKQIDNEKYDRQLLDLADILTKKQRDGRISEKDMEYLINAAKDGKGITEIEKKTLDYIVINYNLTNKAKVYYEDLYKNT